MSAVKNRIRDNLARIRENIATACRRSDRSAAEVTIVAVTKGTDIDGIVAALELGVVDLGENRVQQLVERRRAIDEMIQAGKIKLPAAPASLLRGKAGTDTAANTPRVESPVFPRWHMIGHLQRNKVKPALDAAHIVHSVDSLRLAEEINDRAEKLGRAQEILLEVNCSQEPQKAGCAVGAAMHLAELISTMKHIRLAGLMTMAELSDDPEHSRPAFALLRELFDELRHNHVGGDAFRHLSMGMSQDYAVAVEEGATMVRIGTALFA